MGNTFVYNQETAIVGTKRGKIRGYQWRGLSIFKGIPYAKAKRFHAPEPVEAWDQVLDCTNYGFVCPLFRLGRPNGELITPHRYWPMDEDCLNLNVWTPACDDRKRAVLVWFHGGGYAEGSSIEQVAYEGENMALLGDVVVVSVNHRLNILGYLDLSAFGPEYENSGNRGGEDIIASLKWVKENIAAFGGDPDNVTVFGQSGGGAKVTTLLQTPAADGLYHRGINISGVIGPLLADCKGSGEDLGRALLQELGLETVQQMETIPYGQLVAAYEKVKPELEKAGKYVGGKPHPNKYYVGTPDENGFRPETANIPMIIGTTFGEFAASQSPQYDKTALTEEEQTAKVVDYMGQEAADILIPLFREAYPGHNLVDLLVLDFMFRQPCMPYIRDRSALNNCTWSYIFDQSLPFNYASVPGHCSDVAFVFHNLDLIPSAQDPEGKTRKVETEVFDTVMAFAKTGNPNNPSIPEWPSSWEDAEQTMIFGEKTYLHCNHDHELMPEFVKYMGPIFFAMLQKVFGAVQH